ncbi:tRNA pseudouridine synthase family protein [Babesia bovis T2Bo]|uniref:tRNA pseudouridine synthase family protein n=1 Tax=Babesia bovis T2Bo TaxID=484906 RepID=UPI001DFACABF|nr:tRNA pseudouridine synthase family protein [Babesia bovis T2Bo]EDO07560.2 tRNA pseudouridine synthase family protein [Babesia bovis T2Bo]
MNGNVECALGSLPTIHVPKTKYAIAFGYIGTNYHGFQIQRDAGDDGIDTVEARVINALVTTDAIHGSHKNNLGKLQLSKASRTDKGVHAACTYIGGRFELSHLSAGEPGISKEQCLVSRLNTVLPDDIRCFQVLRVTRGFCARSMCSKRMYEYVIPLSLLRYRYVCGEDDNKRTFEKTSNLMNLHMNSRQNIHCKRLSSVALHEGTTEERDVDMVLLQSILSDYCGSHDFKNFTQRQKVEEKTTQRFIHEIKVEGSESIGINAVRVIITGQSFLYNQIRKMIGLGYAVYLGVAPRCAIKFALSKWHAVNTPLAPAEGLFLHHPYFDAYNRRCSPPQTPFIEYDDIESSVENFKRTRIYPEIASTFETDVWKTWMEKLLRNPFYLENADFHISDESSNGQKTAPTQPT